VLRPGSAAAILAPTERGWEARTAARPKREEEAMVMVDRANIPVFRNEPVVVLVLGILTCGLYLIYWNLKAAEVLNAVSGREVISPVVAVLSGCCGPVNVYFYYLCGHCLHDLGVLINNPGIKDKSTLLLILGIFFPMVAAMIVQGHINELYQSR
jgi:hypothetical protein